MARYIARRAFGALLALIAVTIVTFVLVHLLPGNVAWALLGRDATAARAAALARKMGLDLPLPLQYLRWLGLLFQGGLQSGFSLAPPTLELLALGGGVALVLGLGAALVQERLRGSFWDHGIGLALYTLYTFPSFWLGMMLIYLFSFVLFWFPGNGPYDGPGSAGLLHWAYYMVLPVAAISLTTAATWTTHFRAAIGEALQSDYVRTARAKGMTESRLMLRHVMRNAALPIVTVMGMSLPGMFNNVVAIEWVFHMQGLGAGLIGDLAGMNYGGVVDLVLVIGFVTVLGSLLADLLYAFADPRIQFS